MICRNLEPTAAMAEEHGHSEVLELHVLPDLIFKNAAFSAFVGFVGT